MIASIFRRFRREVPDRLSFLELRQRCAEGDRRAQQEFVKRYESLVWHAILGRMSSAPRQDQEEAVFTALLKLLEDNARLLLRYDPESGLTPESYIYRQATFCANNAERIRLSAKRRAEVPIESEREDGPDPLQTVLDGCPDPEQQLLQAAELGRIRDQLFSRLSPSLILTFQMLYDFGLEDRSAAQQLGCSIDALYMRRKRILDELNSLLEEESENGRTSSDSRS